MNASSTPVIQKPQRAPLSKPVKFLLMLALAAAAVFGTLIVCRIFGLLRPFSIPAASMAPTLNPGDHIMMGKFSYLFRRPHRGDIVVFKTDGIDSPLIQPGTYYVKRIAGEPGEHVHIADGKLFINDKQVTLSNALGAIVYDSPRDPTGMAHSVPITEITVPENCYFVLGDNSTNSLDSRYYGCVPAGNIIGRVEFCYWPPEKMGGVK